MTKQEAINLAETKWWKNATPEEIVEFQINERCLCMDFRDYHEAIEKVLGRSVWTHEFADNKNLKTEFYTKVASHSVDPIDSISRILRKVK